MNKNSLSAYYDKSNQKTFNSQKAKIFRELKKKPKQSCFQLAKKLSINYHKIRKRLTDLINEGMIEVCGERLYNGNMNSLYKVKDQLPLFPVETLNLRKWLKEKHPSILHEFEVLKEKAL